MNSYLLTRFEAAQYLGISVRTLDRLTQDCLISSVSRGYGCRRHFRQQDLDRYIKRYAH